MADIPNDDGGDGDKFNEGGDTNDKGGDEDCDNNGCEDQVNNDGDGDKVDVTNKDVGFDGSKADDGENKVDLCNIDSDGRQQ